MPIEVLPPRKTDHKNRVRLQIEGRIVPGWLSPELSNRGNGARTVVLVSLSERQIPLEYRSEFARFQKRVDGLDSRRFSAAKKAVQAITRSEWSGQEVRIAVHKMGPVPAFALLGQAVVPHQLGGKSVEVVVFPMMASLSASGRGGQSKTTTSDLFDCLVSTDPDMVFRTYFEDVFEHLKDISDNLGLVAGLSRIREIREVQGQSIRTKLHALTPSKDSWRMFRNKQLPDGSFEKNVGLWFDDNAQVVAEALLLTCLVDRCVDHFFDLLGITLGKKSKDIRNVVYDLDNCKQAFCEAYQLSPEVFGDLPLAEEMLEVYGFFSTGATAALRSFDSDSTIVRNLRDFLDFISLVKNERRRIFKGEGSISRDAVVFVSRRFSSPFGRAAIEALEAIAVETSGGSSRVTTFFGDAGSPIRRSVKAQLWLSDAIWSVIPEQDVDVGENLDWIYLEAEHAMLCAKESYVWARSAEDLETAIGRMENITSSMLADNVIEDRVSLRASTLSRFSGDVALLEEDVDRAREKLRVSMRDIRERSVRARRITTLVGLLRMFEANDVEILNAGFREFGERRFSKKQYVACADSLNLADVASVGHAFTYAYDRCKVNALEIDGRSFQLMSLVQGTRDYELGLMKIARALAGPNVTDDVLWAEVEASLNQARR